MNKQRRERLRDQVLSNSKPIVPLLGADILELLDYADRLEQLERKYD